MSKISFFRLLLNFPPYLWQELSGLEKVLILVTLFLSVLVVYQGCYDPIGEEITVFCVGNVYSGEYKSTEEGFIRLSGETNYLINKEFITHIKWEEN